MEKAGRRPMLLGGMLLMEISAIVITIALIFEESVHWFSYVSIVCIILTVIGFSVGLGEHLGVLNYKVEKFLCAYPWQ